MAAQSILSGSIAARTAASASEAVTSAGTGVAFTLTVEPSGDDAGFVAVVASFSVDGSTWSTPCDTKYVLDLSGSESETKYGVIGAPAGVAVSLSLRNASDEDVTCELLALAV
jgi:hypothetical protein